MLETMFREAQPIVLALILPVLAAGAYAILATVANSLKELSSPAIRKLKPNIPAIDLAMRLSNPQLRAKISENPITPYVMEFFAEDSEVTPEQAQVGAEWLAQKFNFEIHEHFNPEVASSQQEALAGRMVERLEAKLAG